MKSPEQFARYSAANDSTLEAHINLILHSSADDSLHHFRLPATMHVADFVELALARLAKHLGKERVEMMRRYYQPVLQLIGDERELSPEITLAEAGIGAEVHCHLAARPRKDRMICCAGF